LDIDSATDNNFVEDLKAAAVLYIAITNSSIINFFFTKTWNIDDTLQIVFNESATKNRDAIKPEPPYGMQVPLAS
jgi:hypothetical protein